MSKKQVGVEYFDHELVIHWREDGADWLEVRDRATSTLLAQFATWTEVLEYVR